MFGISLFVQREAGAEVVKVSSTDSSLKAYWIKAVLLTNSLILLEQNVVLLIIVIKCTISAHADIMVLLACYSQLRLAKQWIQHFRNMLKYSIKCLGH